MGLLDKVKSGAEQAAAMAKSGAEKAKEEFEEAKTKRELGQAYEELGKTAFALLEKGTISHADLSARAERVRSLKAELEAEEAPAASASGPSDQPPATPS
jgi:hypothetical protein